MGTAWNKTVESASKERTFQYDASVGHRTDFVLLFARDIFMQYLPALEILSEEKFDVCLCVCMPMFKLFINWTEGKNGSKFESVFLPFEFHFKRTEWMGKALRKNGIRIVCYPILFQGRNIPYFSLPVLISSFTIHLYKYFPIQNSNHHGKRMNIYSDT